MRRDLLAGPDEIEITTTSKTLEELGLNIHNEINCITIIPGKKSVYWANGIAVAGVNEFPTDGACIDCSKAAISTRQFITATGTAKIQVIQEGGGLTG